MTQLSQSDCQGSPESSGALPSDRAVVNGAQEVSALRASVPSAVTLFTPEAYAVAHKETERLSRELDITNADHIALWLEANLGDASLGWLAVKIVEAHEAAITPEQCADCNGRTFAPVHGGGFRCVNCKRVYGDTQS